MNASKLLIAGAFAAMAAVGAQAGEVDLTPLPVFHSTASVAQVRAGAVAAAHMPHNGEIGNPYVAPMLNSDLASATVRAEAVVAQRAGKIVHGEADLM